jgi:hypothetical protein
VTELNRSSWIIFRRKPDALIVSEEGFIESSVTIKIIIEQCTAYVFLLQNVERP